MLKLDQSMTTSSDFWLTLVLFDDVEIETDPVVAAPPTGLAEAGATERGVIAKRPIPQATATGRRNEADDFNVTRKEMADDMKAPHKQEQSCECRRRDCSLD